MALSQPSQKFIQYEPEATALAEEIIAQGGLAWVEDDYGTNMSGGREYMGKLVRYFPAEEVGSQPREEARRLREVLEEHQWNGCSYIGLHPCIGCAVEMPGPHDDDCPVWAVLKGGGTPA